MDDRLPPLASQEELDAEGRSARFAPGWWIAPGALAVAGIWALILLALAGCTGVSEAGRPQVEIAPGYVATICETSVGLTGHKRGGGVMFTAK